jgi:osmotically-inducible protein OsmY
MRVTQLLGTTAVVLGTWAIAGAQPATSKNTASTPRAGQAPADTSVQTKDAWITMRAKIALMRADDVDADDLNVDTRNGIVTLHGTVETAAEKAEAGRVARGIDGVKGVNNLVQVVPDAQRQPITESDDDVKRDVTRALDAERSLRDSSIKVASVNNGVVLLIGEAKSYAAHLKAIELTRGVSGVKRIASEITVDEDTTMSFANRTAHRQPSSRE